MNLTDEAPTPGSTSVQADAGSGPADGEHAPLAWGDELDWLLDVLGTATGTDGGSGRGTSYLGRPSAQDLRLLVPIAPAAAAAGALRRFDDDRGPTSLIAGHLGRAAARFGLLGMAPGQRLVLPPFELVEHLARVLGEPKLLAAITIGQRRRNRKPVLQLLTPDGRTIGFAKVGWSPLTTELVTNEADILRRLEGALPDSIRAPLVVHEQGWRNGRVVVTTALRPEPLLEARLRPRGSFAAPTPMGSLFDSAVWATAAIDRRADEPVGELKLFDQWRRVGVDRLVDLDELRRRHGGVRLDTGLWHGDLTPWNVLAGRSSIAIWDWEFADYGRPLGFDALHHEFETHRRAKDGTNHSALITTVGRSPEILAAVGIVGSPAACDAIVDLYLCELVARELRLNGQRWTDGTVAGVDDEAVALLQRRTQ